MLQFRIALSMNKYMMVQLDTAPAVVALMPLSDCFTASPADTYGIADRNTSCIQYRDSQGAPQQT